MRKILALILLLLSLLLLSLSAGALAAQARETRQSAALHRQLQLLSRSADAAEPAAAAPETVPPPQEERSTQALSPTLPDAGLAALREANPDCLYWLTVPGTVIDYPVMFHPQEKDYYLRRDFCGNESGAGTLYLDEDCDPEWGDNLIIYGHHMKNGSMFAALEDYKSRDFWETHRCITLRTGQGTEHYRVLAAFTTEVHTGNDFAYYDFTVTGDPEEYGEFVRECRARSFYETGETAVYGRRLLTLSTCEYSRKNGRMVVVAVRVPGTD